MKFLKFMLPFIFCSFGIFISAFNPIAGLMMASLGLPLWFLMRWVDPENKQPVSRRLKNESF